MKCLHDPNMLNFRQLVVQRCQKPYYRVFTSQIQEYKYKYKYTACDEVPDVAERSVLMKLNFLFYQKEHQLFKNVA